MRPVILNRMGGALLLWALAAAPADGQAGPGAQAAEHARVVHLLQRTTFGVRPQDVQAVLSMGTSTWLDRQLQPARIDDQATAARLERFSTTSADMTELVSDFQRNQQQRRQLAQRRSMENMSEEQRQAAFDSIRRAELQKMTPEQRRERQMQSPQNLRAELVAAKLTRAVYSERQLEEMMNDFWFNHFNVYFDKGLDRYMIADYERTAIRPHVFGKFRDMLEATAKPSGHAVLPGQCVQRGTGQHERECTQATRPTATVPNDDAAPAGRFSAPAQNHASRTRTGHDPGCAQPPAWPERELRSRIDGAAHAGRGWRLHAEGCD